jgi:ABC-type transport system involved in multi-copper enzyme maturation permease subunit
VDLVWVIVSRELRLTWLLLVKEVRELLVSRALWAMVLISAPLVGFSFLQAVGLYSQASATAVKLPQLIVNQNPLDGIVIRVFAAVYLMNTFLFPFVAIRAIGNEKQTGSLKLALQLPVGLYRTVGIKLVALMLGWCIALLPTLSALLIWSLLLGGHLYVPELVSVFLGHLLYGLVIAGVSFLAAAITESAATAAIVALAFTLASWILDFAGQTATGGLRNVAQFSLTPALRGLEQGLLGSPTALALLILAVGFFALTIVWLPPGVSRRTKWLRSGAVAGVAFQALLLAIQVPVYMDGTEDQRNSFNPADARALQLMIKELRVNVNLASGDNRFLDFQRNVLTKLQRTAPHLNVTYADTSTSNLLGGTTGASYGEITYTYGGKQVTSRAITASEVLPLIEALDGLTVTPDPIRPYPGYPLVTSADGAAIWFYGVLPLLAIAGWWYFQQPPEVPGSVRAAKPVLRSRWPWLKPYIPALRRTAIVVGVAFVVAQFIPYGREHTNISVSALTPTVAAAGQWCPPTFTDATQSKMKLGVLRQQVGNIQSTLGTALGALTSGDVATLRSQYMQLTRSYAGVSTEIAELYPLRCRRLFSDRMGADAAILGAQVDPAAASLNLTALQAGLSSVGADLDQRIRTSSPDGLVGNNSQARLNAANGLAGIDQQARLDAPLTTGSPTWDSDQTQQLATRACGACHSNTPAWPWYANLAPLSWVIQHNVDAGRAAMNFSEWDVPQANASGAAAAVRNGSMPPAWAGVIDSHMQLTDAERAQVSQGLQATFSRTPQPAAATSENTDSTALIALLAIGIVFGALALAFRRGGPVQARPASPVSVRRT